MRRGLHSHEYPGIRPPKDTVRGWETQVKIYIQERNLDLPEGTILPFQGQEETSIGQRDKLKCDIVSIAA
jgi:hypothetical protein